MLQLIHRRLLPLILSIIPAFGAAADGQVIQSDANVTTILFVNGVNNDRKKVVASSETLIKAMTPFGIVGKYNFDYFYNPTDGLGNDSSEVSMQVGFSASARQLAGSRDEYYHLLGKYYNSRYAKLQELSGTELQVVSVAANLKAYIKTLISSRAGVTVVPHSQGNLYAEAAYAMLVADGEAALLEKIRLVGVAVASSTSPSDRYITHSTDTVINGEAVALTMSGFAPMQANQVACWNVLCGGYILWDLIGDPTAHGFQEIYLNDGISSQLSGLTFPKVIYNYIASSLQEIESTIPPPPPANPIVVFDNLGDRQFCTTTSTSVSCSGEPIGFIPGFGTIIPPQLQVKAAISFVAPASCPCDVTTFELPMYLSGGNNYFFVTFRRDAGGLPDMTTPGGIGGFSFPGAMPAVSSFAANPAFTTTVQNVDPTIVSIQPNVRYWMEVFATDTTRAVWPFGRTGTAALVATTRSGNPYVSLGDAAPAVRLVVTPR